MIQVAGHLISRHGGVKEIGNSLKKCWQEAEVVIFSSSSSNRVRNPNARFLSDVSGTTCIMYPQEKKAKKE